MQQFKGQFKDPNYTGTQSNIQRCIRLNDIDELGDGTHLISFDMVGLFSFREMTIKQAVDFWMKWLGQINLLPDTVTIHPDKMDEWRWLYDDYQVSIRSDVDCVWSDGDQGGYCTEFYINDIEIGNIVNTNGDCIDVGFGLERLLVLLGEEPLSIENGLKQGIMSIINSGYRPSGKQQGHILKSLLKRLVKMDSFLDHPFFAEEQLRQKKTKERLDTLWCKFKHQPPEWWLDTHGVDYDLWITKQ